MNRTYILLFVSAFCIVRIQDVLCAVRNETSASNTNYKPSFNGLKVLRRVLHFSGKEKETPEVQKIILDNVFEYRDSFKIFVQLVRMNVMNVNMNTAAVEKLNNFNKESRDPRNIESDLVDISVTILQEVDEKITLAADDYLKQAAYYRILSWVRYRTSQETRIVGTIDAILKSQKKARNYLAEIYTPNSGVENKWINSQDPILGNVADWQKGNKYDTFDEATYFMKRIVDHPERVAQIPMTCTDLELYEDILKDADPHLFQKIFNKHPCDMIEIIDEAFVQKTNTQSLYTEAMLAEDIDLSKLKGDMEKYKHATILFASAFRIKFGIDFLSNATLEELKHFPTRHASIRYCAFQRNLSKVPREMQTNALNILGGLSMMTDRLFFHRLLRWYSQHATDRNLSMPEMKAVLDKLLKSKNAKHVISDMSSVPGVINSVFSDLSVQTHTLHQLLSMGQELDLALSTVMRVTLNELEKERKAIPDKIAKTEDHTMSASEINKQMIQENREKIQKYINAVLSYGMPEIRFYDNNFKPFNTLSEKIDRKQFMDTFGQDLIQILNKVGVIMNKQFPA